MADDQAREPSGDQTDAKPDYEESMQHDYTDARGQRSGAQPGPALYVQPQPMEQESSVLSDEYKMTYPERGFAVIINNKEFEPHTNMGSRTGTDLDATNIYQCLANLGFEVHLKKNQTVRQMKQLMIEAANLNHRDNDCFACVILSHGEEGAVYGTDGHIEIKELVEPFKGHKCKDLAGKPKLFFIQACRGQALDKGVTVGDALGSKGEPEPMELETYRIPTEADFLMAYSVVPGYFSWRNSSRGSWFIQALCDVLKKHGETLDLMTMMTRVNKKVAYDFESNASKEFMNRKKQIPCITSMLTKDVYFRPKQ